MRSFLLLSLCAAFANADRWTAFLGFVKRHDKIYESMEHMEERFRQFRDNMEYAEAQNRLGWNYTLGETAFADLSVEEFQQYQNKQITHISHIHYRTTTSLVKSNYIFSFSPFLL